MTDDEALLTPSERLQHRIDEVFDRSNLDHVGAWCTLAELMERLNAAADLIHDWSSADRRVFRDTLANGWRNAKVRVLGLASFIDQGLSGLQGAGTDLPVRPWPDPPSEEVYHGVAGDIVRTIAPHTEADPIAILVQFLVAFGNVVGRSPHFRVEADRHYTNVFALLVGETSKGRKGSAWGHVRRLFGMVDADWTSKSVKDGLSTGEGAIWAVRDPVTKLKPISQSGQVVGYQTVTTDPGVTDKRTLFLEPEFARVLSVMMRQGSTLSETLRQAWDARDVLATLTKHAPAKATAALISMIGHVSAIEFRRRLDRTDAANGFLNRFLLVCVRRQQVLPDGGAVPEAALGPLISRLKDAVAFARTVGEVSRDDAARALWAKVYPELSKGRPGLLGTMTSRTEAQVLRLSLLYALLDQSTLVREPHLRAALALADAACAAAAFIFGDTLGNPVADKIWAAIRVAGAHGLSLTEISRDVFAGTVSAHEIRDALQLLVNQGLIESLRILPPGGKGRPEERWYERNERNAPPAGDNSFLSFNSSPATGRAPSEDAEPDVLPPGALDFDSNTLDSEDDTWE